MTQRPFVTNSAFCGENDVILLNFWLALVSHGKLYLKKTTPEKFNIASEKWWLEVGRLLGRSFFRGDLLNFRGVYNLVLTQFVLLRCNQIQGLGAWLFQMFLPFFAHHPHKHGQETKPQLLPGVFHVDVSCDRNPLIRSYSWDTFVLTKICGKNECVFGSVFWSWWSNCGLIWPHKLVI